MSARIGLVGAGWWATFNHIPTVQKSSFADIVAICDLDSDRANQVGETFNIAARYTDLAAMLREENLDGLIVSTPHVAHREPAVMGLQAGAMCWSKSRWPRLPKMVGPLPKPRARQARKCLCRPV
jgi:predicted dehydrogenase